jgi:hypothetical protein
MNALRSIYNFYNSKYNIGITLKIPNNIANLFTNGILQNAITMFELFKMCKNVDNVYILVDNINNINNFPEQFEKYKKCLISFEDSLNKIDLLIMSALRLDENNINIMRERGIKVVIHILGSSYHIFNENIVFGANENTSYNSINLDEIWISPHLYEINKDFSEVIYNCKAKSVPYVWSNYYIEETLKMLNKSVYKPKEVKEKKISVYEPNINYVKTSLFPIIIGEKFYKSFPNYVEKINIFCSDNLYNKNTFVNFVLGLESQKNSKLFFEKRYPIVYSLFEHSDIVLAHQRDLEYNYLYFDAAWLGFPLVHNSERLKELGYYYKGFDGEDAVKVLKYVCENFENEYKEYLSKSREYISKFLYTNENNIREYEILIENLFK